MSEFYIVNRTVIELSNTLKEIDEEIDKVERGGYYLDRSVGSKTRYDIVRNQLSLEFKSRNGYESTLFMIPTDCCSLESLFTLCVECVTEHINNEIAKGKADREWNERNIFETIPNIEKVTLSWKNGA